MVYIVHFCTVCNENVDIFLFFPLSFFFFLYKLDSLIGLNMAIYQWPKYPFSVTLLRLVELFILWNFMSYLENSLYTTRMLNHAYKLHSVGMLISTKQWWDRPKGLVNTNASHYACTDLSRSRKVGISDVHMTSRRRERWNISSPRIIYHRRIHLFTASYDCYIALSLLHIRGSICCVRKIVFVFVRWSTFASLDVAGPFETAAIIRHFPLVSGLLLV